MSSLLNQLPSKKESNFGLSWANLVDFIAALQYDVDYNKTNYLQGMIVPPRMLTNQDHPPFISDFTPAQNRALVVADLFNKANQLLVSIPFLLYNFFLFLQLYKKNILVFLRSATFNFYLKIMTDHRLIFFWLYTAW